jgi:hypothetical protein
MVAACARLGQAIVADWANVPDLPVVLRRRSNSCSAVFGCTVEENCKVYDELSLIPYSNSQD